jgi:hypothetical protein
MGRTSPLIHSFLSSPIPSHNALFPSTISIQRSFTTLSCASTGNRYDIRLYIASCSSSPFVRAFSGSGISLIRRDPTCQLLPDSTEISSRISPIDGPPKHLRISADDPPSSDTGSTKAGEVPKAVAIEFAPVPPDITT